MGIFDSITELVTDVAKVVVAPVEIAVDVTKAVVKPVAEVAEDVVKEVKTGLRD